MILLGFLAVWYFDWQDITRLTWAFAKGKWHDDADSTDEPSGMTFEAPQPEPSVNIPDTIKEVFEDPPMTIVESKSKPKPAVAVVPDSADTAGSDAGVSLKDKYANFRLPSIKLLNEVTAKANQNDPKEIIAKKQALQQTLESFGIDAMAGIPRDERLLRIETSSREPNTVQVGVSDTGTGVDLQDAERIFEPFVTEREDGMGMGLAICRSIVEEHDGRIWAVPNDPSGTTFLFQIPTPGQEERDHAI